MYLTKISNQISSITLFILFIYGLVIPETVTAQEVKEKISYLYQLIIVIIILILSIAIVALIIILIKKGLLEARSPIYVV